MISESRLIVLAQPAAREEILSWWFVVEFFLAWVATSSILAFLSGWQSLARRFRAVAVPTGTRYSNQVTAVGWISQCGVTNVIISQDGLYLYVNPFFRFLHPPVLIPWADVTLVGNRRFLWSSRYTLSLGSLTTITLSERVFVELARFINQ